MTISLETRRIVVAGASSLLGTELKTLLEESRFAACDFRLVDEEIGILTEAAGEPTVIQPVEEDSFRKAWIIFFAGSAAFTQSNLSLARGSGARIIDLSGALAGSENAHTWLANLVPADSVTANKDSSVFVVPSAPAEIIARLAIALNSIGLSALSAVAFYPVSASAGKAGIEELESQTGQLLSFQTLGRRVFDSQAAFAVLDRFGASSAHDLRGHLRALRTEVRAALPNGVSIPAIQLLHAPVFYGATATACAHIDPAADAFAVGKACAAAGFAITSDDAAPSNITAAGETSLQLAPPTPDASGPGTWWFWAAADNLRLPAANAVKLAESFLP